MHLRAPRAHDRAPQRRQHNQPEELQPHDPQRRARVHRADQDAQRRVQHGGEGQQAQRLPQPGGQQAQRRMFPARNDPIMGRTG